MKILEPGGPEPPHDEPLAVAEVLGAKGAELSGFTLPHDGLFRIYWSYDGNGMKCYGADVTLEKK